jgi:hypothetical protein
MNFGGDQPGSLLFLTLSSDSTGSSYLVVQNSTGGVGQDEIQDRPADWLSVTGKGIAVFAHPQNPTGPTHWRFDPVGVLHADPWRGLERLRTLAGEPRWTLATGEAIRFLYRLYLHAENLRPRMVRQHFVDYAFPPRVEVLPGDSDP